MPMMRIMPSWKNQAGCKIGCSCSFLFLRTLLWREGAQVFITYLDYMQSKWGIDKCAQKQYNTDTVKEGSKSND